MKSKVDFSYAFATPHRMTVARPDSGDKTLLDLEPGTLRMSWSYDSLATSPFAAFVTPPANWAVKLTPQINGHAFRKSSWTRGEAILPVLTNAYEDPQGKMTIEVVGAATAAVARITAVNTSDSTLRFALPCESQRGFFGYNPAYVDPDKPKDHLLAGWGDRADRVIVLALGADDYLITGATTLTPVWDVAPGETRTAWLIRPYRAYTADVPALRARDWQREADDAKTEWRALLKRASKVHIPDPGVEHAFYACLADCFIMREPVPGGKIAGAPGTDGYRAASPCEPGIISICLDQLGLHKEAADGYTACFDAQGDDGDWADPQGWGHLMWLVPGFKSWTAIEHYKLSRDRAYLEAVYPKMLASSRFNERQRARTRVMKEGARPLTYGLMPPGMGDCGLKDGDDLYGVYFPHNFWSVYADSVTLEAAQILGKSDDIPELKKILETARADLLQALDKGAIPSSAEPYRWIPGVPGKTCGSRWGALNALTPCNILPRDHELITGTIRYIESNMSPGGLPLNTGWLPAGLWVAIALDNLAEAHLVRNEGDAAAALMYATLNHGTPLYTWCEERAPEPGATQCTGDRQHLWTPVAVVRCLRDMLIMEDGDELHLARGTDRDWLASGSPVGIDNACTHFGTVSYQITFNPAENAIKGKAIFPQTPEGSDWPKLKAATLHIRLPQDRKAIAVGAECKAAILPNGSGIRWDAPVGEMTIDVKLNP